MVTLFIDGEQITVESGTSVLNAAERWGIRIPTLCYDHRLSPYGACGICVVEVTVNGRKFIALSCLTAVEEGMRVATHSPDVVQARRRQLMLLLRSHPLLCPTCDAAGDCKLQDLVREYEIAEVEFPAESRAYHIDNQSHFIRFNMNLCVKCWLCVRICEEIQGENELSMVRRGLACEVTTDFGRALNCEFCGQCAQICPVGAISSKWQVSTGRPFELTKIETVCSFCSLGCTLALEAKDETIVYVNSPPEGPNEGNLCVKGRYGWPYVYSKERLNKPLVRKNGLLEEVEWDEALSFVAEQFKRIRSVSSPGSLAALGSARLTNEEAYAFNRFVRTVMETPHLDHGAGYAYSGLVDGLGPTLGYPASTHSIREIRNARVIVLFGADLSETHPVAKNEVIIATGPTRDGKVVVVDSVRTRLCDHRGIQLLTLPGTEYLVAFAMLKEILDKGLCDEQALGSIEDGVADLAASLEEYSPENMGRLAGVDPEMIRRAATEYAEAPTATIVLTAGVSQAANSVELAQAAANLALVTGRLEKESCGVHVLGEKANSQGAIDMGLAPDLLPGFHSISDEKSRAKFETVWGFPLPSERGLGARQILSKAETQEIRGLYVVGENPLETYPDRSQVERALRKLELLVVQDLFLTPTARMAHAVFPAKAFVEKRGTYTSAERRVQLLRPIRTVSGPRSDLEIFTSLAARMGRPFENYAAPEQVMEEIANLVKEYAGISYLRLGEHKITWPSTNQRISWAEPLYAGSPPLKPRLVPAPPLVEESRSGEFPFYLIPRVLKFHSGSFSQWSPSLMEVSPDGIAEMNREDMLAKGLKEDDRIRVTSSTGDSLELRVKRSWRAVSGSIIVPRHFALLKLNRLTTWNEPQMKVRVEKA